MEKNSSLAIDVYIGKGKVMPVEAVEALRVARG
jgi:hypothetical protein